MRPTDRGTLLACLPAHGDPRSRVCSCGLPVGRRLSLVLTFAALGGPAGLCEQAHPTAQERAGLCLVLVWSVWGQLLAGSPWLATQTVGEVPGSLTLAFVSLLSNLVLETRPTAPKMSQPYMATLNLLARAANQATTTNRSASRASRPAV